MIKDFFELLVKDYGLPEFMASYALIVIYFISGIFLIFKTFKLGIKILRKRRIRKIVNQDLHPYFTHKEIYNYTRFYVPQYFQNISPTEGEDFGKIHAAAARSKLMPEFLNKGLLTKSDIKYFMILSDTGMGKTAFLINLYIRYKGSKQKINRVKYNIELIPLGASNALEKIKTIKNKCDTILLLDAFDEDIKAIEDYQSRMTEILDSVKEFRKIIFTCRTQFFPTKDEEPRDTDDITFGENVKHSIHKIYLSAFDNKDVFKYLFKKYGLNIYKLILANRMVKRSPSLMFRPMLLSYINELIREKIFYSFSFEMYTALINNWTNREANKPAISEKYGVNEYSKNLWKFSRKLAVNLYEQRELRQGYFITKPELEKLNSSQLIDSNSLTIEDKTGRSLLNRNSVGEYKFAHKSILEYFLALEVLENPDFLLKFDFVGMDATEKFHKEMIAKYLTSLKGSYCLASEESSKPLTSFLPKHIDKLNKLTITNSHDIKFKQLAGLKHIETIILTDKSYLIIYMLYLFACFEDRVLRNTNAPGNKETFYSHISRYQSEISRIRRIQSDFTLDRIKVLIDNCDMDEESRILFNRLIINSNPNKTVSIDELIDIREIRNHISAGISENVHINNAFANIEAIKKLDDHIPEVNLYF